VAEFIGNLTVADIIMYSILAFGLIVTTSSLIAAHRSNGSSKYKNFNVMDLFCTGDGHVSRPAVMEITAFMLMSWGFVTFVLQKNLTDWYAGIYVGTFVLRAAHSAYLRVGQATSEEKPREMR
jgi:hypothetical protein